MGAHAGVEACALRKYEDRQIIHLGHCHGEYIGGIGANESSSGFSLTEIGRRLQVEHLGVAPVGGKEVVVGAILDHPTLV